MISALLHFLGLVALGAALVLLGGSFLAGPRC